MGEEARGQPRRRRFRRSLASCTTRTRSCSGAWHSSCFASISRYLAVVGASTTERRTLNSHTLSSGRRTPWMRSEGEALQYALNAALRHLHMGVFAQNGYRTETTTVPIELSSTDASPVKAQKMWRQSRCQSSCPPPRLPLSRCLRWRPPRCPSSCLPLRLPLSRCKRRRQSRSPSSCPPPRLPLSPDRAGT